MTCVSIVLKKQLLQQFEKFVLGQKQQDSGINVKLFSVLHQPLDKKHFAK